VLAGVAPAGVLATDDVDALIGNAPDCVVYTPRVIDYAPVERMLRTGINLVTTGDFLTGTHHRRERAALATAAAAGGATLLGTGFEPGFVNVVAGFLSGACRRVHSVKLIEISAVELKSKQGLVEHAVATRDLDLGWITFGQGTVAGQRRTYRGYRNGRVVVELAICWTMSDDALNPQWSDPNGFKVKIEGEPRVDAVIRFGPPHDGDLATDQDVMGLLMTRTAMAAVNAIPHVCDAQPGVITPIDLPLTGTRGALID
jgi:hypothetical protein